MTELESAMATLMKTFDTYSADEGKKDSLSKAEAKRMLEKELPSLLKAPKNQGEVDQLLKALDFDGDSEITFPEYMVLMGSLACACHGYCAKK